MIYDSEIPKHFAIFSPNVWKNVINTKIVCPHRENNFFTTNERYLVCFLYHHLCLTQQIQDCRVSNLL